MDITDEKLIRYIRNPDVVLREEDDDGALLFNPDTNQIKVINPTGLFIWNQCDGSRNVKVIGKGMVDNFDGAQEDKVNSEIEDFLKEMVIEGFIGVVD